MAKRLISLVLSWILVLAPAQKCLANFQALGSAGMSATPGSVAAGAMVGTRANFLSELDFTLGNLNMLGTMSVLPAIGVPGAWVEDRFSPEAGLLFLTGQAAAHRHRNLLRLQHPSRSRRLPVA